MVASSSKGNVGSAVWSPTGNGSRIRSRMILGSTNIYLVPVAGGQERGGDVRFRRFATAAIFGGQQELYFLRASSANGGGRGGRGGGGGAQIYVIALEKQDHDPEDVDNPD